MKANMTEAENKQDNDVRHIPKWTGRYVDSRAVLPSMLEGLLGPLLLPVLFFITMGPIILLSWLLWRAGYTTAGMIALACAGGVEVSVIWLLVRHWARYTEFVRALAPKMGNWIYRGEGDATARPDKTVKGMPHWLTYTYLVIVVLPICILPYCEFLPPQYLQPLTALLWLPLLLYSIVRPILRGELVPSALMLLWPGLYAVHAVLIMAGLPIYPTGPLAMVAICGLFVGYGLIAGLAAHIYSRIALRRLRAIARSPEAEADVGGEEA